LNGDDLMAKLNLDYLYGRDINKFQFYQIPKLIIKHENFSSIDYSSKLLYGLMIDRASCSAANGKDYMDSQGHIYILFPIEQIMKAMGCSSKTAVKMTKQLEEIGLIEIKKRGQGKASLIYVKDFSSLQLLSCKKYNSGVVESTNPELEEVQRSNTNLSETNLSDNNSIHPSSVPPFSKKRKQVDLVQNGIKESVRNELLKRKQFPQQYISDKPRLIAAIHFMTEWDKYYPSGYLDEHKQLIYNLFNDALIKMCHSCMKFNGDEVAPWEVIERINQLATFTIDYIDISAFSELAMGKYAKGSEESGIRTSKLNYMASCIWDAMLTGQLSIDEEF
jgi:DNA-binding transcriptional regulator GbsR (MarR family)